VTAEIISAGEQTLTAEGAWRDPSKSLNV